MKPMLLKQDEKFIPSHIREFDETIECITYSTIDYKLN